VDLYFEDDDEVESYKIVTTVRGNSLNGLISNESPIGKAVMGHKVGDRVMVEVAPGKGYYVEIRAIDKNVDDDDELRSF
jgi:transcription elongation factor GreA